MPPPAAPPAPPLRRGPSPGAVLLVLGLVAGLVAGGLALRATLGDGDGDGGSAARAGTTTAPLPSERVSGTAVASSTTASSSAAPARVPVDSGLGFRWTMPRTPLRLTQTVPVGTIGSLEAVTWVIETTESSESVFAIQVGGLPTDLDATLRGMATGIGGTAGSISDATFLGQAGRTCTLRAVIGGAPFTGQAVVTHRDGQVIGAMAIGTGPAAEVQRSEFALLTASVASA